MTRRIAIVGTSNIGALKYAAPAINAEYPDLDLVFWGLPGGNSPIAQSMRRDAWHPTRTTARHANSPTASTGPMG